MYSHPNMKRRKSGTITGGGKAGLMRWEESQGRVAPWKPIKSDFKRRRRSIMSNAAAGSREMSAKEWLLGS